MPISPARKAAYEVLRWVETGGVFAVDLLQGARLEKLKEVDRNLATELVMGVLRWRGDLDDRIEKLSGKSIKAFDPEIAVILRMGVYQIRRLERIPESAAVNESVELAKVARKRSVAGLVNAVLRKCRKPERRATLSGAHSPDGEEIEAACRSLPAWLRERWEREFGIEGMRSLAWASVQVPRTTLRVTEPGRREDIQQRLDAVGIKSRSGQYSRRSLSVESGSARNASVLEDGLAVIQDEASQLVAELVAPRPGECLLDVCAAPGIKAGQLAAMQGRGLLVACDRSASRLETTARLLGSHHSPGVQLQLVQLDATRVLPFGCMFDRILVDAPCSGTGTLARNPEAKWRLQPDDFARLAGLQARILERALEVLAPGGRLVYATCSLEPEENERVVESVVKDRPEFRTLSSSELSSEFPHLSTLFNARGYFSTRPDVHGMDGFFAAVLTRL